MRYLLDANIVSNLVRNAQGKVVQHIRKVGEAQLCTSIIVAAELRYGATKKGSERYGLFSSVSPVDAKPGPVTC